MKEPQIEEWVNCLTMEGRLTAEAKAAEDAIENTHLIYKTQLVHTKAALKDDLQKVHDHTAEVLAKACNNTALNIMALKADLKANSALTHSNVEHDRLLA